MKHGFLRAGQVLSEHAVGVGCALFFFFFTAWLSSLYVTPIPGITLSSDLPGHLTAARQFAHAELSIPHPGFHYASLFLARTTGLPLESAAVLVLGLVTGISYLTVYIILTHHLSAHYPPVFLASIAFLLSTVSAIYAPFFNKYVYLGQGTPNIWHNPTWMMMQPFALWSFFLTEQCFRTPDWRPAFPFAVGAALMLLGSTFSKPNFSLAFIPAVAGLLLLCWRQTSLWRIRLVLSGVIVGPSLLLLAWQHASYYGSGDSPSSAMVFAPFVVWRTRTPNIPVSVFLALAFPIGVILAIRRGPPVFQQHPGFLLAWLLMTIAFLQRALLTESVPLNKIRGNWGWGYMIALKIIFIYSAIALLRYQREVFPHSRIGILCSWGTLFLHFASGLFYLGRLCSRLGFI